MTTLEKVKLYLRRSHDRLDEDIQADIDTCLADLRVHGVVHRDENDPLIFNAIKLYCKSMATDDSVKASAYCQRYFALRDCLKVAEGYGWKDESNE